MKKKKKTTNSQPRKKKKKKKEKRKKKQRIANPGKRKRKRKRKKKTTNGQPRKKKERKKKESKVVKSCGWYCLRVPHVCLIIKMPLSYELWKLKIAKNCFQFP